jgi:hypothetical protein
VKPITPQEVESYVEPTYLNPYDTIIQRINQRLLSGCISVGVSEYTEENIENIIHDYTNAGWHIQKVIESDEDDEEFESYCSELIFVEIR